MGFVGLATPTNTDAGTGPVRFGAGATERARTRTHAHCCVHVRTMLVKQYGVHIS